MGFCVDPQGSRPRARNKPEALCPTVPHLCKADGSPQRTGPGSDAGMRQMRWRGPDVLTGFRTTTHAKIKTLPLPWLAIGMSTLDLHPH